MPAWHLRPRSAPEVIDASIQLLRQHARPLLLLAVVIMIPGAVFGLVNALLLGDLKSLDGATTLPTMQTGAILLVALVAVASALWFVVAFGALVGAASSAYVDGAAIDPAEALRRVRPRAGVLLGAGILIYLLIGVQLAGLVAAFLFVVVAVGALVALAVGTGTGAVFSGLIGVASFAAVVCGSAWLVGRYATLPAVAVNETLGVGDTMRRARELSRGSSLRVTGLLLVVGVLFAVVTVDGMFLLRTIVNDVVASVLLSVVNVPLYAFAASVVTVLYYDLRVRHEGLDIEMLAQELSTEPTLAGSEGH
jgi:hypothetical protein